MLALTLYPWWVTTIAYLPRELAKDSENRTWPPDRHLLRGERIAIHAGAMPFSRHGFKLYDQLEYGPVRMAWRDLSARYHPERGWLLACGDDLLPLQDRAIVCTARVMDWDRVMRSRWDEPGPMGFPLWHWRLADVVVLARPVPVKHGRQRLWRLPADIEAEVSHG